MPFFSQTWFVLRTEAQLFLRYPQLLMAALAVVMIPALYGVIYLSSVWDPAAKTGALPVAVVNLDNGMEYWQHDFNVGQEVVAKLQARHAFGFMNFVDEAQARRSVREGSMAFALIIPPDFSANAIPGAAAGAGKLVVYTSEGNSYQSSGLARRFAQELGHEVNESLNERRWALVLSDAAGSQRNIDRLHAGVEQLRAGAHELTGGTQQAVKGATAVAEGSRQLAQSVVPLAGGVKELGAGLRTMDAKRPRRSDLKQLQDGAQALSTGHGELGKGLDELKGGTARLTEGVTQFKDEANSSFLVSADVKDRVGQLSEGVTRVDTGLASAALAQGQLAEGANRLNAGVTTLIDGVKALGKGIHTAAINVPPDNQIDELTHGASALATGATSVELGAQKLRVGAQRLEGGLDLLATSLPPSLKKIDGSAEGLATSVQPQVEVVAAVENNGSGFAPNILSGSLWLGASLAAFLIQLRVLPLQAQPFGRAAKLSGKVVIPLGVVALQVLVVCLLIRYGLEIAVMHWGALILTLALAAATFLMIIVALTRALGDAGKALALVFLAVQLSSSGGVLPVELSGGLFAQISPWMPITWVVKSIRAAMFGAFDGGWQDPLELLLIAGLLAAVMAAIVGRWRYIQASEMRPALDF
ncbi:YhgE/Pip domain-containing protein [Rhodoferax sp. PAMC 29310]|uniref:YhgE/Pip domain-containing protein n=1 Tax=Rhodoferax sp. PAMC 29310 TaxID=2822760 RepID=UPI001B337A21|nr:YhgE/Pip domain-containing protein [Rhodoferax sp. PAMC 29310]